MVPMTDMRRGRWVLFVYYYAAALIGLVMLLFGVVGGLRALVVVALPETSDEVRYSQFERVPLEEERKSTAAEEERRREEARQQAIENSRTGALAGLLNGVILAGVGAPVLLWHLRHARREEPTPDGEAGPTGDSVPRPPPDPSIP